MQNRGQHDSASNGLRITDYGSSPRYLEQAIYHTLHYFDILGVPLTATQLWRTLLVPDPTATIRWEGHHAFRLAEIQSVVRESVWLKEKVDSQWGYYFLHGRHELVAEWLARHRRAQQKWKILRRVVRVLAWVPFVDMVAASGSLALYNTKPTSDLDVLVVARGGRIWTARLLLLAVTQLLGRRRKHWDEAAPDKVCLNHYLSSAALVIAPEIRNVYTAMLYTHLHVLYGEEVYRTFLNDNASWLKRLVMYREIALLASPYRVGENRFRDWLKRHLEAWLLEPVGDYLERGVGRFQRRAIVRHTVPHHGGRVVISDRELAFHPHSKVEGILHQFAQDIGQQRLL